MAILTTPRIEQRPAQPCMFIRVQVRMGEIEPKATQLIPRLLGWLGAQGVAQDGPVFFRYNVIDMDGLLEIDVGAAVKQAAAGDGEVRAGTIPGGRYAVMRHTGHPDELMPATAYLLAWGQQHGVAWRKQPRGKAEAWDARFEFYLDGPDTEPDMAKWRTDLAFQVE